MFVSCALHSVGRDVCSALKYFAIPHVEMCACDWSKLRHTMVSKSR